MKVGQWVLLEGPQGQQFFSYLETDADLLFARGLLAVNFRKVPLKKCKHCTVRSAHEGVCLNCFK